MVYGARAMSLVEVRLPSPHYMHFNKIFNDELRSNEIDFLEERIDDSQMKLSTY